MRVRRLRFQNIRNHVRTELEAAEGVNVITGLNGEGKTSVLEAIALSTLTRSFVGTQDAHLLRRTARFLEARLETLSDYGVPHRIEVHYETAGRKSIRLDGSPAANAAQVIGAAPTVVLSPDLKAITGGAPAERRRFIDLVISQAKRRYLEDLMHYRRILKQRNSILSSARQQRRPVDRALIEPWDEGLIERAVHLMSERSRFVREFEPIFRSTVAEVAGREEEVAIRYDPDSVVEASMSVNELRDALWLRSREVWREEQRRGTTLFGPHRDDLRMSINGGDVRSSASQGQHKTLLIALKIAEFHYLAEQCAETPIILLDDIFGELDARRAERVYDLTRAMAQVFITVVSLDMLPFLRGRTESAVDAVFTVEGGRLRGRDRMGHNAVEGRPRSKEGADDAEHEADASERSTSDKAINS